MVKASAPGKLYLFGEHAVMYGAPSIVTAIDKRMMVDIEKTGKNTIIIDAMGKHGEIPFEKLGDKPEKEFRFVISAVKNFFEKFNIKNGLRIKTSSDFDDQKSFGSSAAVTVATLKALVELFGKKMSERELFDLGLKANLDVQTVGSGFDIAAAVYGGTLFFEYQGKKIEPLKVDSIPIIYAKLPEKFDSPEMIKKVKEDSELFPELYKKYIDTITDIVIHAIKYIHDKNWNYLGKMMSANQGILAAIGINTTASILACHLANQAGAYGAKMTGGGGDNIIILADPSIKYKIKKKIEAEFPDSIMEIKTNAQGVKIEH